LIPLKGQTKQRKLGLWGGVAFFLTARLGLAVRSH
jgi:hypothetical protein